MMALKQCIGNVMLDMLKAGYTIRVHCQYNFRPEAIEFVNVPSNTLLFQIAFDEDVMKKYFGKLSKTTKAGEQCLWVSHLRSYGSHLDIYCGPWHLKALPTHEAQSLRFVGDLFERYENRRMELSGMDAATTTLLIQQLQECPALKSRVILHKLDRHSPDYLHPLGELLQ